jgi:hypothetical protein
MTTNKTSPGYPNIQIAGKAMIYWLESIGNTLKPEQQCMGSSMVPNSYVLVEAGEAEHTKRRGACAGIACRFTCEVWCRDPNIKRQINTIRGSRHGHEIKSEEASKVREKG